MVDFALQPVMAPVATAMAAGRFVISGTTLSGRPFRPGDWAHRLATAVGSRDRNGRIRFHPQVRVVIADGAASLVVDGQLARTDPPLYTFLKDFARSNELRVAEI